MPICFVLFNVCLTITKLGLFWLFICQFERFFTGLEWRWVTAGKPVQNDKAQFLWILSGALGNGCTQNDVIEV